jgi:ABC-type glycerol-3-phosphate transport system substrate-binding protein
MMVNAQHLMYRRDLFDQANIAVPGTYEDLIAAAEKIRQAGVVRYPFGGTWKTTWLEFVNMYLGYGGDFFVDSVKPAIANPRGIAALEMMRRLTAYMDPEYLVADATYVQQQFQQGRIAMANYWASRAAAMDDPRESQVVGKIAMAAAPLAVAGGLPASTLWWDGIVIARNISDAEAEAAFRVALEGMDAEMAKANVDAAIWIIPGATPTALSAGAAATAANGAKPYPASIQMGLMQKAIANRLNDFLKGTKDAATTLAEMEAEYRVLAKEAGLL